MHRSPQEPVKLCLFHWSGIAGLLVVCLALSEQARSADLPSARPNIIFILCDDLGYGDVKCNNPEGKIATPNVDRLATAGMRFTDAHSTSSVCTPTRYSVLTGRYNWRTRLQEYVIGGLSPRLIEPGRLTVADFLRRLGYHTACIGKWHLGMDWAIKLGKPAFDGRIEQGERGWDADYTQPIANGPNSVGFDYFFGISASLDMYPYTFIENDRVCAVPTVDKFFPMILGGRPERGGMVDTWRGAAAADFEAVDVLPTLTRKAVNYITEHAEDAKAGKPFFLYLPLNSPHTPIAPTPEWRGRSGLTPFADFVMETDACIGEVICAIEEQGMADNTLIIVTSDNGTSPSADIPALLAKGHSPLYVLRGHKADIWDGGHRVPYIVCWPGKVQPGSTSDQLVSLVDFMATCAEIVGEKLPDDAAEDSVSMLPVLLGKADKPLHEALVHHSIAGKFAIRQGQWKLALCAGSGGWSQPTDAQAVEEGLPPTQLYDMVQDIGERHNLQAERATVVEDLIGLLQRYVSAGRSTPGVMRKNDATVDIWKRPAPAGDNRPK